MKALTIIEPWASLIVFGHKRFETRSWSTRYRGPLAIHASKNTRFVRYHWEYASAHRMNLFFRGYRSVRDFHYGCVVGVADLVEVHPTADLPVTEAERRFGDFSSDRYAWELTNVRRVGLPVAARGQRMLWNLPAHVEREVMATLGEPGEF